MDHHITATATTDPIPPFADNSGSVQIKRKPGRPPKLHRFQVPDEQPYQPHHFQANYSEPIFASLGLADDVVAPTPPAAKRGRGRPPKAARSAVTFSAAAGRGGSDVEAGMRLRRRKPGRPKLIMANGGGAKRIGVNTTADGDGGSVSRGRGRGRPPKSYGGVNKGELGTAVVVTDPHQLVAFQELKLKYEHLQSKAKEVLCVVRPYINSDYAEVQELETLVADVASSSNV